MKRWPLLVSFVLFIALCVSATYWGMQLYKPPVRAVAAPLCLGLFGGFATGSSLICHDVHGFRG